MRQYFINWILLVIVVNLTAQNVPSVGNKAVISKNSSFSVEETAKRIETCLKEKEIPVFAVFDHEKNAEKVGLFLRPNRVIVFGSPKVGTQLMQDYPEFSIQLPLKIAVWENKEGKTWVTFPSMIYLAAYYRIDPHNPVIQGMQKLMENLTDSVIIQTE